MLRKLLSFCCLISSTALATTFELPQEGSNIVGNVQYHKVQKGENLSDIAKQYDVGFLALMAANKGIDPFVPPPDYVLTIPSEIILPQVKREGIVVNIAELRLYYFDPNQEVVHIFPIGIGRIGRDTPVMETTISQMVENPTWTPPASIRKEYLEKGIELPPVVPAGPDNPLGMFKMRLAYGAGDYLIHGTNKDFGIGMRVSSGCIRLSPTNIDWLFHQVHRGVKVKIINEPIKLSWEPDHALYIEAHEPLTRSDGVKTELTLPEDLTTWLQERHLSATKARAAILAQNGLPIEVVSSEEWSEDREKMAHSDASSTSAANVPAVQGESSI